MPFAAKERGVTKSSQWMKGEMKVRCMDVSKFRRVIMKYETSQKQNEVRTEVLEGTKQLEYALSGHIATHWGGTAK